MPWTFCSTLRAKGTLISEPRFSTPCEMRFFPREKGENGQCRGFFFEKTVFRERPKGGGKLMQRGGGTYRKTPPQKRPWTPPPAIRSPPPLFGDSLSISLTGKRRRPDQPQFLRPPKSGFGEHAPQYVFHPQIHMIRFPPPLSRCPTFSCSRVGKIASRRGGRKSGLTN